MSPPARAMGLGVTKRFVAEVWRVALLDIESELLRGAVAALQRPDATLALCCDVSDQVAVTAAIEAVDHSFGGLDALVNNAGVAVFAPLLQPSDAAWNRGLAVNLTRPAPCTSASGASR